MPTSKRCAKANHRNGILYIDTSRSFVKGKCLFEEVTVELCTKFREYLMTAHNLRLTHRKLSQNSIAGYFSTFRGLLKVAYRDKLLKENINDYLDKIEWEERSEEYLTQDELIILANTPCKIDVLKRASLFSCLTDFVSAILRISHGTICGLPLIKVHASESEHRKPPPRLFSR